jgi:lipopolysaccharide export system protein LptA
MRNRNASSILFGLAIGGAALAVQGPMMQQGDAKLTNFGPYSTTINPKTGDKHFVVERNANSKLRLHSESKGLDALCDKAEGDVSSKNLLTDVTFSGGVKVTLVRKSAEATSSEKQKATVDGSTARYTASSNVIHVQGRVTIHDDDPGAGRSLVATGSSADLSLSPQGSKEQILESGVLYGPVVTNITGVRAVEGSTKKAPFHIHTTSAHAMFDNAARTLTLVGNVNVESDVQGLAESGIARETMHFDAEGSVDRVEGSGGEPGITTIDPNSGGNP